MLKFLTVFLFLFAIGTQGLTIDLDDLISGALDLTTKATAGIIAEDLDIGTGLAALLSLSNIVSLEAGANLTVQGTLTLGSGTLQLGAGAVLVVESLVVTGGELDLDASAIVQISGEASFEAETTVGANISCATAAIADVAVAFTGIFNCEGSASVEANGEMNAASGSQLWFGGAVTGEGSIRSSGSVVFESDVAVAVSVEGSGECRCRGSSTYQGAVSVSSGASLIVEGAAQFSSGLVAQGAVEVSGSGSAAVTGAVEFSSSTTYTVNAASTTSTNYLTCTGEATFGGELVVNTDVEIDGSTEIVIAEYGSRASASAFATVTVMSGSGDSKRALLHHEYEVEYGENQAVIKHAEEESSGAVAIASLMVGLVGVQLL